MTTFFSYSAVNTTFKDFTICTLRKALLRSQVHQRDRAFSQVKKPVRLICPELLQKCEIDTERKTEVHFTQLLCLWTPELPLPAVCGETRPLPGTFPVCHEVRILPQVLQNMTSF